MRKVFIHAHVIAAAEGAITIPTQAEVPPTLTIQERLLGSHDQPVTNGNHAVTFSIWVHSTSGLRRRFINGDITENVLFGSCWGCVTPLTDAFSSRSAWLKIAIAGVPQSPRMPADSVPDTYDSSKVTGDIVPRTGGKNFLDIDMYIDYNFNNNGTPKGDTNRLSPGGVSEDGAIELISNPQTEEITVNEEDVRKISISGVSFGDQPVREM